MKKYIAVTVLSIFVAALSLALGSNFEIDLSQEPVISNVISLAEQAP